MRSYYKNDPYQTTARYGSTCPDCNKQIKRGDDITVWPASRKGQKARHWTCSESDYLSFEAAAADEYMMTGGAY